MFRAGTLVLACLVIAAFVALAIPSEGQTPQQHPATDNSGTNTNPDQRGTQSSPLAVQLMNTGQSDAETAQETAHVNYEEHTERWIVGLTVAAVLVALLQLASFITQAVHMKNTVKEMRRANDTTEKALLVGERPWVGVESVAVSPPIINQVMNVIVLVRNTGKSPALNHRGNFVGLIRAAAQEAPATPLDHPPNAGTAVLMPNGAVEFTPFIANEVISQEQLNRIHDGRDTVWLVGRMSYQDGRGHPHTTTLRAYYHCLRNCFITSAEGNEAD